MTDLPPRAPLGTESRHVPETRSSQTSMWLILLVVIVLVMAVIALTMNRSVQDNGAAAVPSATDQGQATGTVPETGTEATPTPDAALGTDDAPASGTETGTGTAVPPAQPEGTDGTAPANP